MIPISPIVDKYKTISSDPDKENLGPLEAQMASGQEDKLISRDNYSGHITASGMVISPDRKLVLKVFHKKLDRHLQPGGHIERDDETPLAAAIREIDEETGIKSLDHIAIHADVTVPLDIDTHDIPKNDKEPGHVHHDFRYLFVARNPSELKVDEEKHSDPKWLPIAELANLTSFERLKPKIMRALSNEFRSKLFFDRVASVMKAVPSLNSIVVAHVVPDAMVFLRALHEKAPIVLTIPKPKSCNESTLKELNREFCVDKGVTRESLEASQAALINAIKKANHRCVLFDIGGYFSNLLKKLPSPVTDKIAAVVEDTENGHQKYAKARPHPVPVISVARSPLKRNEDYLVGQSVLYSADTVLRDKGFNIEYRTCAVLGYGKIGSSIASHLLARGIKPLVYDKNPILRIEASNRLCSIPSRSEILSKADVIFCATGNRSLGAADFYNLKPGCVVCTVTSHDDELDLSGLTKFEEEKVSNHLDRYSSFGNHFYLVNKGNAVNFLHTPALGSYIHLVRAEMLYCVELLSRDFRQVFIPDADGIFELCPPHRDEIAAQWLKTYADSPLTHSDLGVAG